MATTKPKESSADGKEKRVPSSNSHITSTKKTTKPSTTTSGSTEKATSTQSEKQVPNYLKPTISSRVESQSFRHLKSADASQRPILNRRRSLDKPPSPSRLPKQSHPSLSRLHKALVSPGPRERTVPLQSSSFSVKAASSNSKPISERNSKTARDGKTQQPLLAKSVSVKRGSTSSSTNKKVADKVSARSTNKASKSAETEATKTKNVQAEPEVKEATNEEVAEVVQVEDEELVADNVSDENPPHDENIEPEQELDESDHQPQVEADEDAKVILTVSAEEEKEENAVVEVAEAEEEKPQEEKADEVHEKEENTNQGENNMTDKSHPEEQPATDGEALEIEKKEEEGEVIEEQETEDDINKEEKEGSVEEGVSEDKVELKEEEVDDHAETGGVEERKNESTQTKQQTSGGQEKKDQSQTSNDAIEETASKLLEARKNKVRALAGAFQTVIDHQTSFK